MRSRRVDAFEEVAESKRSEDDAAYSRARDLVSKRADEALEAVRSADDNEDDEPRHTPHTPFRPLFSPAARRLIRAHERIHSTDAD